MSKLLPLALVAVVVPGKKTLRAVSIANLRCSTSARLNLDPTEPTAGIPVRECRAVAGGKPIVLREAAWLLEALARVDIDEDCGMGRCELDASRIDCTVDVGTPAFTNRFACRIDAD